MAKGKTSKPAKPTTSMELFVMANQQLISCYEKVDPKKAAKMTAAQRNDLCSEPKEQIKKLLREDSLAASVMVANRIDVMNYWIDNKKIPNHEFGGLHHVV